MSAGLILLFFCLKQPHVRRHNFPLHSRQYTVSVGYFPLHSRQYTVSVGYFPLHSWQYTVSGYFPLHSRQYTVSVWWLFSAPLTTIYCFWLFSAPLTTIYCVCLVVIFRSTHDNILYLVVIFRSTHDNILCLSVIFRSTHDNILFLVIFRSTHDNILCLFGGYFPLHSRQYTISSGYFLVKVTFVHVLILLDSLLYLLFNNMYHVVGVYARTWWNVCLSMVYMYACTVYGIYVPVYMAMFITMVIYCVWLIVCVSSNVNTIAARTILCFCSFDVFFCSKL